jgi:hypothetical protein
LAGASTDLGDRCAPTNRYRGAVLAELVRSLAALEALRAQARTVPGVGPLLEATGARTKRIRESTLAQ